MTPGERREKARERQRAWRARNPERNRELGRAYQARRRAADPEFRERAREKAAQYGPGRRQKLKAASIAAYGGFCACCGESELIFLTIDHIDGEGNTHRRELFGGRGGGPFYRWLAKNGFPPGFQVLCFNCNLGKHINGGVCPHQQTVLRLLSPKETECAG